MIETFTILSGAIALISVLKDMKRKNLIFWSLLLSLIIFDGLRWEMGTDWIGYSRYFEVADVFTQPGMEPGFTTYTSLIRNLTDNYSVYLLVTTAFIYIGIFYTIFKITNYSFISLFYLVGTIPWYSGSLRQMMATVFFTLALKSTLDRKLVPFIIFMAIGLMFHTTMMVFIPMYWLYGMSSGTFIVLFLLFAVLSFFSRNLIAILDTLVSYYSFDKSFSSRIGGTFDASNPVQGFLRKIFFVVGLTMFSLIAKSSRSMDELRWGKIKFLLMLASFTIIFYYIGTYHISFVSSRVDIYVSLTSSSVLIGLLDKSFKTKENRILLFLFVATLVGVFYYRLEFMDLFHPYSSVFYNYDLHRDLY